MIENIGDCGHAAMVRAPAPAPCARVQVRTCVIHTRTRSFCFDHAGGSTWWQDTLVPGRIFKFGKYPISLILKGNHGIEA